MERSKRNLLRNFIVAKIFLSFFVTTSVQAETQCSNYGYSDQCTIDSLWITPEDVASLKFPIRESIELTHLNVDYLSPEIMERMKWVSKLTISNGRVPRIYLKRDLQQLSVTESQVDEVIIDAEKNENLEVLTIVTNNLKVVPMNIEKLKALTTLQLQSNQIEMLDMNKFRGLEKLVSIDLSSNRLYYLEPVSDLMLPRLKTLDLSNNYLTELDFANWIMQRLQILTLSSNRLSYVMNVETEAFPSLQEFSLSDNAFDCRWLDHYSDVLSNISLHYNYGSCLKSTQLSPATYRKLNISDIRSDSFQFETKELLEKQINGMVQTSQEQSIKTEFLSKSVTEQAKQLAEANDKLQQQQTLLDDLLVRIDGLHKQVESLQELSQEVPAGRTAPGGLRAKLIHEMLEVIRKNVPE